jgi:hypothetical protein
MQITELIEVSAALTAAATAAPSRPSRAVVSATRVDAIATEVLGVGRTVVVVVALLVPLWMSIAVTAQYNK